MGNFDVSPSTGSVSFGNAGTWFDYFSGQTFKATGNAQSFTLAPGEYHLYVNQNVNNVDTSTKDSTTNMNPGNSLNLKIYPNPVTGSGTVITYQLPLAGNSNLAVYSISGQQLGVLSLGNQSAGQYTLTVNQMSFIPSSLANGYYILKLTSAGGSVHAGFLVVRQ
jgi:hypothetical protein